MTIQPDQPGFPREWQTTRTLELLREVSDLSRRVVPALARRAGLTHTEMETLEALMEEPLGPSQIAQRLGVTSAAASGIVDRLVDRGHVTRELHPHDRRRTVVAVTPAGRAEMLGHLRPMFTELAGVDTELADADREAVERFLEGACRALRRLL